MRIINTGTMIHRGQRSFIQPDGSWKCRRFILSLNQYIDKHISLFLRFMKKLIAIGNRFVIYPVGPFQRFVNNKIEQGEDFKRSFPWHSYWLRLFHVYYTKKIVKKDFA